MDIFEEREARTAWFQHDRFGMFIHWGLYAIPGRGEWVQSDEQINRDCYAAYLREWNPSRFDAAAWARTAKNAGMKYAVLTAKHHEGFCLFDSQYTDYKSTAAPFGRDIVREFVDAFRAEGLKVGLYFSLLDWHHPDYPAYGDRFHPDRNNKDWEGRACDWKAYLTFMHNQTRELLSNYGKIDILWFDFSYEGHLGEDWDGTALLCMARDLQPGIIVNGRLEASGESYGSILTDNPEPFCGDFANPEMIIPPYGLRTPSGRPVPWEANFTLNNNWGYNPLDGHYKSGSQIIRKLVECVSKGGNMMVNVSPNAKGEIPDIQQGILNEVGSWLRENGESIYGCGPAGLEKPEWGRYTRKGNTLYAHILDRPIGALALPGLKDRIMRARRLSDGYELRIVSPWVAKEFPEFAFVNFGLPDYCSFNMGDTPDMVLELELNGTGV
jgi:alpha-L-fucosidase